ANDTSASRHCFVRVSYAQRPPTAQSTSVSAVSPPRRGDIRGTCVFALYAEVVSDTPRQTDDRRTDRPSDGDRGSAGGTSPEAPTGTSPFDEPTAEIPTTAPPQGATGGAGAVDGALAHDDAVTQRMPRAHVVSREDDVAGAA